VRWRSLIDSAVVRVVFWSAVLLLGVPYVLKWTRLTTSLSDGVLIGTGVAIIWYTFETYYLRREMAEQNKIGIEQNKIAREQSEAAIQPLLVSRIEMVEPRDHRFVIRNIGHGPAPLFVEIEPFTTATRTKGIVHITVDSVDVIEAGSIAAPELKPFRSEGGQLPDNIELVQSLYPPTAGGDCKIVISYEDIRRRPHKSVMQMGRTGVKFLGHGGP
jgi:hypothetical protein